MSEKMKADFIMTPEELAFNLPIGWVMVCRNYDGMDGVGMKYLGNSEHPIRAIEADGYRAGIEAAAKDTEALLGLWSPYAIAKRIRSLPDLEDSKAAGE